MKYNVPQKILELAKFKENSELVANPPAKFEPFKHINGKKIIGYDDIIQQSRNYEEIINQEAEEILKQDLYIMYEKLGEVAANSEYITPQQNWILAEFAFSIGFESFSKSKLLEIVNSYDLAEGIEPDTKRVVEEFQNNIIILNQKYDSSEFAGILIKRLEEARIFGESYNIKPSRIRFEYSEELKTIIGTKLKEAGEYFEVNSGRLKWCAQYINVKMNDKLTENQYIILTNFAYYLGHSQLKSVINLINKRDMNLAVKELKNLANDNEMLLKSANEFEEEISQETQETLKVEDMFNKLSISGPSYSGKKPTEKDKDYTR